MLTSEQIAALRDAAGGIADPINRFLLDDIARRIAGAGQLTSTAAYQVWRAQQLGLSRRRIEQQLRALLGVSRRTLRALLAQDDFTNLTQTLGMVGPDGAAYPLQKAYQKSMDYAFEQTFTGATDYNTAVRQASKRLADMGVRVIDYESGVHTSLEAAVRRNVMGGLGLLQEQISRQNHDDMGADGWEISAHAASAPDHEPIQGKQYSDGEYEALNDSLQRRIGTLNCGHAAYPIILGVNSPQYTPEALRKFREENAKGLTYQGRHYTMYEATQKQRQVETAIRVQKRRILTAEATGDAERLTTAQIRLQRLNDEYLRFSKAAGLPTQRERAQVAGFGRGQAARAASGSKEAWEDLRRVVGKNAPKSLEDFNRVKYTGGEEWRRLMENKRLFEKIDGTASYSEEYKVKMKQTYQYFETEGFIFREHALNRVLGQRSGKEKFFFTQEDLLNVLRRPENYRQPDGKLVRFYDGMAAISAPDTGEVVSVVIRSQKKGDWDSL